MIAPWPYDTELDPRFPFYTRGNADEVLPGVLSPLMSTFGRPLLEQGFRRMFGEVLPVLDPTGHPATWVGVVGGRAYLNLSTSRRHADLSPGISAEDFDHQFAASNVQLPPYVPPDERGYEERGARIQAAIAALLETPPRDAIEDGRTFAARQREEGRATRAARSDAELVERCDALAPQFVDAFVLHVTVSSLAGVTFGALAKGLRERAADGPDVARRLLSGLGEAVDSAAPGRALAHLATLEGDDYRAALGRFLERHGHRGADEWELGAPSWDLAPDAVERTVAAARDAPAKPDTAAVASDARIRAAEIDWAELEWWLPLAEFYVAHRERTKSSAVVLFNELRLDLFELGRRHLPEPAAVALLTENEVRALASGAPPPPLDALDHRRQHMHELRALVPPLVVEAGNVPPLDTWRADDAVHHDAATADVLTGVAGSPGRATGRVRVVRDPYADEPPQPGEVLVAPITDPGWTLLFVAAEAVVVEVGGELSHAVIAARELGIPAVVSVPRCCDRLRTGDVVEVDGSTGVVRVLERASPR